MFSDVKYQLSPPPNSPSQAEDKAEVLNKELLATKSQLTEAEEEKKQWELEANQVKEMCRRELDRLDTEIKRSNTIIADYKQVRENTSEGGAKFRLWYNGITRIFIEPIFGSPGVISFPANISPLLYRYVVN